MVLLAVACYPFIIPDLSNEQKLALYTKRIEISVYRLFTIKLKKKIRKVLTSLCGGEVGCQNEDDDGITKITDARHGWCKSAKDSSVVAIGKKTQNHQM